MGQTVYADVLFLINFSMDFLVFYICARLSGRRLNLFRSVVASALGGAYGVASLFIEHSGAFTWLLDLSALLLICATAFAARDLRASDFIVRCMLFALISALLGGMMMALSSALERSGIALLDYESGDDLSVWLFAILAAAGGAAAFAGGRRIKRIASSSAADMYIEYEGKSVTVRAMTDTGNMLSDPLSGRSVALCELEAISNLLSPQMLDYFRKGEISADIDTAIVSQLRFIPARGAVGGESALLPAIAPDLVRIINDKVNREADILIAPVRYDLSVGESRALLPPGLAE